MVFYLPAGLRRDYFSSAWRLLWHLDRQAPWDLAPRSHQQGCAGVTQRRCPAPSQASRILPGQNPTKAVKNQISPFARKSCFFLLLWRAVQRAGKAGLTRQGKRGDVSQGCGGRSRQSLSRHKWRRGVGREGWEGAHSSAQGDGRLESPMCEAEINAEKGLEH